MYTVSIYTYVISYIHIYIYTYIYELFCVSVICRHTYNQQATSYDTVSDIQYKTKHCTEHNLWRMWEQTGFPCLLLQDFLPFVMTFHSSRNVQLLLNREHILAAIFRVCVCQLTYHIFVAYPRPPCGRPHPLLSARVYACAYALSLSIYIYRNTI